MFLFYLETCQNLRNMSKLDVFPFIKAGVGLAGTYLEVEVAIVCINGNSNRNPKGRKNIQNDITMGF